MTMPSSATFEGDKILVNPLDHELDTCKLMLDQYSEQIITCHYLEICIQTQVSPHIWTQKRSAWNTGTGRGQ